MISIIVAISQENAIGIRGGLLCHLPGDLRHFKAVTSGKTVLMGERTYFSLPRHPLPNRRNIVLTDRMEFNEEGVEAVHSMDEALALIASMDEEVFIIGGGMVYRQFMPHADRLYITHMHHSWPDADTFFPEIDSQIWEPVVREAHEANEQDPYSYTIVTYKRK